MAKKAESHPKAIELHELTIKRSVEKTDAYDERITKLQNDIDYFHWGIKPKTKQDGNKN